MSETITGPRVVAMSHNWIAKNKDVAIVRYYVDSKSLIVEYNLHSKKYDKYREEFINVPKEVYDESCKVESIVNFIEEKVRPIYSSAKTEEDGTEQGHIEVNEGTQD